MQLHQKYKQLLIYAIILADFANPHDAKYEEGSMARKLIDKDEEIMQASQAIKAIAHPLRLKILCVLGDKEVSVQDIVDYVGTSQSNISQHLAILRDKGVLATRKDANRVYYRIGDPRTIKLVAMMREVFCTG